MVILQEQGPVSIPTRECSVNPKVRDHTPFYTPEITAVAHNGSRISQRTHSDNRIASREHHNRSSGRSCYSNILRDAFSRDVALARNDGISISVVSILLTLCLHSSRAEI